MLLARLLLTCTLALLCLGCPGVTPATAPNGESVDDGQAAVPEKQEKRPNALQRVAEFVDRNAYMEAHPDAIELEKNSITASDPISSSLQGFQAAVPGALIPIYEREALAWKVAHDDKWPTYAEFKEYLDKAGVEFKGLKKNQVYGYNDQNGQITILEIPKEQLAE